MSTPQWFAEFERQEAMREERLDKIRARASKPTMPDKDDDFGEGECTCRRTGHGGNDPDAGWRLDKWCPIHGLDPDDEYEKMRERKWDR